MALSGLPETIKACPNPDCASFNARTARRLLERAGPRARDFHQLQLERAKGALEAVQLDEMHGPLDRQHGERKKGTPTSALGLSDHPWSLRE
jgi:hypothetical protein